MSRRKSTHPFIQSCSYLQNYFSYVIKEHKNDPVLKKASIQNVVSHCFGDHEKCDERRCSGKFDEVISTNHCRMEEIYVGRK